MKTKTQDHPTPLARSYLRQYRFNDGSWYRLKVKTSIRQTLFNLFILPLTLLCLCDERLLAEDSNQSNLEELDPQELMELDLMKLSEVPLVTATQIETPPFSLPFSVAQMGPKKLERLQPRSTPEALQGVSGVMIQKTARGQASPYIRGFTSYHTLMMIDGIRLNNSVFRSGPNQYWTTVDPYSLNRLELVKGSTSVLYGSDAVGGVVNALTKGAIPNEGGTNAPLPSEGVVRYRYGSAEHSHIGRAEYAGFLRDDIGLHIGGTWKDFGNIRGGRVEGLQQKTGFGEYDLDTKIDYYIRPQAKLSLAHQTVSQDDIKRTHSTLYGSNWEGVLNGGDLHRSFDQQRKLTYLKLHTNELPGFIEEMDVTLSHQRQGETQKRLRGNRSTQVSSVDVDTLGFNLQLQSPSKSGHWVYGTSYYRDWVRSTSNRYNADGTFNHADIQGPVADDSNYDLLGVYVQDSLPSIGPVDFTVGLRYNMAKAHAGRFMDSVSGAPASFSDSWSSLVGNGRGILHLDSEERWNLFAGISQGFRAPNLSDVSRFDIARSGQLEIASTNLKSEDFITYEAGVKAKYDRVEFQAAYFYTDISNLIIRTPAGFTVNGLEAVSKRNSGKGYVHGIEVDAQWMFVKNWSVLGAFTWMDGQVDTFATSSTTSLTSDVISRLMPVTGRAALRWDPFFKPIWMEFSIDMASRQDKLSISDMADRQRIPPGGTPGYAVGSLRVGWRPRSNYGIMFAIENITNEDYRIHGSGFNEPGRNFILSADYKF